MIGKHIYSQVELLVPHRVQFLGHGARSLLDLADLHGDVRVAGAALVLGDQALGADHWWVGWGFVVVVVVAWSV